MRLYNKNRRFSSQIHRKKICKKKRVSCETLVICGSGNWTRTSDIRINSPLFYRLNYARITGHIIYLKSAQVKDYLTIFTINCNYPKILRVVADIIYWFELDFLTQNYYHNKHKGVFNLTCPTFKWTKQGVVICKFSYTLCRILHSAILPVLVAT